MFVCDEQAINITLLHPGQKVKRGESGESRGAQISLLATSTLETFGNHLTTRLDLA